MLSNKLKNQFKPAKPRAERRDGLGRPIDPSGRYFIQDSRPNSSVGNCATWWGVNGNGYTCDLDKAGVYLGSSTHNFRNTDVLWPEDHVRKSAVTHVRADSEALQVREPELPTTE